MSRDVETLLIDARSHLFCTPIFRSSDGPVLNLSSITLNFEEEEEDEARVSFISKVDGQRGESDLIYVYDEAWQGFSTVLIGNDTPKRFFNVEMYTEYIIKPDVEVKYVVTMNEPANEAESETLDAELKNFVSILFEMGYQYCVFVRSAYWQSFLKKMGFVSQYLSKRMFSRYMLMSHFPARYCDKTELEASDLCQHLNFELKEAMDVLNPDWSTNPVSFLNLLLAFNQFRDKALLAKILAADFFPPGRVPNLRKQICTPDHQNSAQAYLYRSHVLLNNHIQRYREIFESIFEEELFKALVQSFQDHQEKKIDTNAVFSFSL